MKSGKTVFETVGGTPLLKLPAISRELDGVELYAKAEYFNPTGSVKDRAAKAMILDGIARGALTHDKTIIDATSGNTGIAYAALGAALGYKVALCLPANATEERNRLVLHFSKNCVDWCFAALVDMGDTALEARHYAGMCFHGDDLCVLSRSGDADAECAHNGNLITFHKIRDFRKLIY